MLDAIVHSTDCGNCACVPQILQENLPECPGSLILLNSAAIRHLVTYSGYIMISSSKYIYTLCLLPGCVFWICVIFK